MQNLATTYAADIRETGRIFVPAGGARTAFIDARDIGRVAATVFAQPGHLRRAYTPPASSPSPIVTSLES